jgi:dTDP-4-amino-4,6-dideoxygalactose transaminase
MPVHLFGQVAKMDEINAIAAERGIPVIEDAAQAIGATSKGRPACSLGLAGCLSFYPTKNLGAFGDAGAICTSDDAFASKCRKLRVHGSGHTYHHEMIGGMFRLSALQAAVLDVKLKYLDQWHTARRQHAALYDEILTGTKVITPRIDEGNQSIYNQYVVRVSNRDAVKQHLAGRGISTGVYYPIPLHLQPCFAYLGYRDKSFSISEKACQEVLALPVYPELPEEQIRYVAETLKSAV